jgi:signal transduction histidine kinase
LLSKLRDDDDKGKGKESMIRLEYHHPQDIFVYADKGRITQVIYDILSNSIKFTKQGSISISLDKKIGGESGQKTIIII